MKVWRINKNAQILNLFISHNFPPSFFQCNPQDFLLNPINVQWPMDDISDVTRFLEKKMSHYFSQQL